MKKNKKNKFTDRDTLYPEAKKLALKKKNLTIDDIKENLRTGPFRSCGLMNMLIEDGVVKEKNIKPPSFAKLARIYKDIDWKQFKNKPVVPLGMDTPTNNLIGNFETYFSPFIVGKNDSERKMFLHCAMVNLLKNTKPKDFKFILIDTRKSNLKEYKDLPNLLFPLINEEEEARKAIDWCASEVNRRFNLMIDRADGFIEDYNKKFKKDKMPRILIVVNDYSDLVKKNDRQLKKKLKEINTFGSFYGIHMLTISSKLSKEACPISFLKAYSRISFLANSSAESKLVIENGEAKKLKGRGDAILNSPSQEKAVPMQCFSVNRKEIKNAVASYKA